MNRIAYLALLLAPASSLAAAEKPPVFVGARAVKDKPGAFVAKPDRAYIMIRGDKNGAPFLLMKEPSAEDRAAYEKLKAETLDKARKRYAKQLANYERGLAIWKQERSASAPAPYKPRKPIEPTEDNLAFPAFELMAQVPIGPVNRFARGEQSLYLHELTPGTYRLYGPVFAGNQGMMFGVCYCLGSVRFTAHAGAIVDLGRVVRPDPVKPAAGDSSSPLTTVAMTYQLEPATQDMAVDARLKGATIRQAEYRAAGKLPNFFGIAVDRLAPVPGVLGYDRDRIIDLAASPGPTASR